MSKLYELLGVNQTATGEDIKKAYKKMAIQHHPDKGGNEDTFKNMQRAYEVLKDPATRQQYDQMGDAAFEQHQMGGNGGNGGGGSHNMHDIFAQMFGGTSFHQQFQQQTQQPARNHMHRINISLLDAFNGFTKNVRISLQRSCIICKKTCSSCNGQGSVTQAVRQGPFTQIMTQACQICGGKGLIVQRGNSSCSQCNGNGEWKDTQEIKLNAPAGVQTGYHIVVKGLGEQPLSTNIPPGDLIFEINVDKDATFIRDKDDLLFDYKISLVESIIGKDLVVPGFDGDIAINTLDFGIIYPGKQIIINDRGMPYANGRGNMIIVFIVTYPEYILDNAERTILEEAFKRTKLAL
jgi:molecular chaperone DnaJ